VNQMNTIERENEEIDQYNNDVELENKQWNKITIGFEQVGRLFGQIATDIKELKDMKK